MLTHLEIAREVQLELASASGDDALAMSATAWIELPVYDHPKLSDLRILVVTLPSADPAVQHWISIGLVDRDLALTIEQIRARYAFPAAQRLYRLSLGWRS